MMFKDGLLLEEIFTAIEALTLARISVKLFDPCELEIEVMFSVLACSPVCGNS